MKEKRFDRRFSQKGFLHLFSVCFAVLLLVVFAVPVGAEESPKEKYERLKEELAGIEESIEGTRGNMAAAEEMRTQLAREKEVVDEMIRLNQEEIAQTEAALAVKEEEIAQKRQVIYENDQLFQQRLIAIYKMNNANMITQVLAVDSFSELLQAVDALQRISEHDTDLLEMLSQQRAELEAQQAEIDAMLQNLNNVYAELANNAGILANNIAAQDAAISQAEAELAAQQVAYENKEDEVEQARIAYEAMLAATRYMGGSSAGDGSEYVGGVFTWPVPASYRITCHFGSPDPNGNGHLGMDIGAPTGTSIVAAGNGVVITATGHSSYGNYLVIDHGNGVKTLYAHCSSLDVGVGTVVSTGQHIAQVGSTGFSTGPHLHFEVHDGGRQNPINYLKG
ncbi:peptidoglycan DD-metalloendopeptidase family protein [Ruminococcaceae bacterium OttesenSCG-928-I18]|nr:peptidoglycan DD-metalloendopeptidase family protein [Ruminococcaceae bacterium OttesenSCG-928-I18]